MYNWSVAVSKRKCNLISQFKPLRIVVLNVVADCDWFAVNTRLLPYRDGSKESSKISICLLISGAGNNPDISIKSVVFSPHSSSMRVILRAHLLCYIISLVE